jgi:translation initiation factor 4G
MGGRRKLNLLPRSIPVGGGAEEGGASPITPEKGSDSDSEREEGEIREGDEEETIMSRQDAEKRVKEDIKELFAVRNIDEAEEYFKALPAAHHPLLVNQILVQVLEKKEADATLVASLFGRAAEKQLCTPAQMEEGFQGTMEVLADISIDAPAAFKLMAIVVKGTRLPKDAVERLSDKIVVEGDPIVSPRKKFLGEYEKVA